MTSQLLTVSLTTSFLIAMSIFLKRRFRFSLPTNGAIFSEPIGISKNLAADLPEGVILPHDSTTFNKATDGYWAKQECEVIPSCIVRPRNDQELCIAVTILKRKFKEKKKESVNEEKNIEGLFAISGGGHSCVAGAASIDGGVLINLGCFNEVIPSEGGDESSMIIGAGCRWMDVSKVLDERCLAVGGGRNSAVEVGGLTLGATTSSSHQKPSPQRPQPKNSDPWRALKGGANNFSIVIHFKARSFPNTKIWSGFLYMFSSQSIKVLSAFHEVVNQADWDKHAAVPLACFTYIQPLGLQAISVNLVHTKPSEKKWPEYWSTSSFWSIWRFWSPCKLRTLTSATDEMNALNTPRKRQVLATTTFKNDAATLSATHSVYRDAVSSLRGVEGSFWTLVLQPLLPDWVRKGDVNPLGLHDIDEPLVIMSLTVNWPNNQDDEFVKKATRVAIEQTENFAKENGMGHKWKYLNCCAEWQDPFAGYGEDNWKFLKDASVKYDDEGLFQRGFMGGFKLNVPVGGGVVG